MKPQSKYVLIRNEFGWRVSHRRLLGYVQLLGSVDAGNEIFAARILARRKNAEEIREIRQSLNKRPLSFSDGPAILEAERKLRALRVPRREWFTEGRA